MFDQILWKEALYFALNAIMFGVVGGFLLTFIVGWGKGLKRVWEPKESTEESSAEQTQLTKGIN